MARQPLPYHVKKSFSNILGEKGRWANADHCWRWGVQEPLILADVICEQTATCRLREDTFLMMRPYILSNFVKSPFWRYISAIKNFSLTHSNAYCAVACKWEEGSWVWWSSEKGHHPMSKSTVHSRPDLHLWNLISVGSLESSGNIRRVMLMCLSRIDWLLIVLVVSKLDID